VRSDSWRCQVVEEQVRDLRRGAFADADHADVLAAHDADLELRNLLLERQRSQQAGAAAAYDEYGFDHRTSLFPCARRWRPDSGINRRAQVLASVGDVTRWR
jgi:hypothetical protein